MYRYSPAHTGNNISETTINERNVSDLTLQSACRTHSTDFSSYGGNAPVVANDVLYAVAGVSHHAGGSGSLSAASISPADPSSCSGTVLWSFARSFVAAHPRPGEEPPGGIPAVDDGLVYVAAGYDGVDVFDADGSTESCATDGLTCEPLWRAMSGPFGSFNVDPSPTVVDGVLYVVTYGGELSAFDASGTAGCSGIPKVCSPLWSAKVPLGVSAPAVSDGVVYVGSNDGNLYAFDARGRRGCSGTPTACGPLWSAPAGGPVSATPAVADGVVYVTATNGTVSAFDTTRHRVRWTATVGSSPTAPAVGDGMVYVASGGDGILSAFDANGRRGCTARTRTCDPVWTATVGSYPGSPTLANGVVYLASPTFGQNGTLYAFDANGHHSCSGSPTTCTALWTGTTAGEPIVTNGSIYQVSGDGSFFRYGLPG